MGKRRRARELALQCLYQWDFHGSPGEEPVSLFPPAGRDSDQVKQYAEQLADGVRQHREEIDRLLESQSHHWKLYRMSRVDRNILRISVYELLFCPEVPPKVSIDEAIEIGKRFGTTESGAFINGILDQICRSRGIIPAEETPESQPESESEHDHPGDRDPG